jgi:hypothetical protein
MVRGNDPRSPPSRRPVSTVYPRNSSAAASIPLKLPELILKLVKYPRSPWSTTTAYSFKCAAVRAPCSLSYITRLWRRFVKPRLIRRIHVFLYTVKQSFFFARYVYPIFNSFSSSLMTRGRGRGDQGTFLIAPDTGTSSQPEEFRAFLSNPANDQVPRLRSLELYGYEDSRFSLFADFVTIPGSIFSFELCSSPSSDIKSMQMVYAAVRYILRAFSILWLMKLSYGIILRPARVMWHEIVTYTQSLRL